MIVNLNSASVVGFDVHVVNSILELLGGLFSMLMHWFLHLVLVDIPNGLPAGLSILLVHHT